ncbi:MAG: response regulator [Crocinitomicaceae bacterium]|nr:response regulator [Crocinitomicaceae bacterium]|tara:strand:- start:832 stop:1236 length:405 start_codon:yes stop_codon:yes gene_type:complete
MSKKLKCVLLIDDDEATNFIHKMVVNKVDCAEKVVIALSGIKALEYLKHVPDEEHPKPDLILVDINMPAMNGWEFLDEFTQLDESQKGHCVVMMLTTSLNPDDEDKSKTYEVIKGYIHKPLTPEKLEKILENYF